MRLWLGDVEDGGATDVRLEHRLFAASPSAMAPFDWSAAFDRLAASIRAAPGA